MKLKIFSQLKRQKLKNLYVIIKTLVIIFLHRVNNRNLQTKSPSFIYTIISLAQRLLQ